MMIALLVTIVTLYGCDKEWPEMPFSEIDTAVVDRSGEVELLAQDQFYPSSVEIGEEITIQGKGIVFPAGFVRFSFSGQGSVEIINENASSSLTVAVPAGTISGPFGFTIAGRSDRYQWSFPTSDLFHAYTVDFPGLTIEGQERSRPFSN